MTLKTSLFAIAMAASARIAQAADKWHLIEAYLVEYELSGTQTGTMTVHSRNHSRETAMIADTKCRWAA